MRFEECALTTREQMAIVLSEFSRLDIVGSRSAIEMACMCMKLKKVSTFDA